MIQWHRWFYPLIAAIIVAFVLELPAGVRSAACPTLAAGDLFKVKGNAAVYLLNQNKERLYFPHSSVFYTWYKNFSAVKQIDVTCVDQYAIPAKPPFGVNYRPGSYLIKIPNSPDVYVVQPNNTIAKVGNEQAAKDLYGADWTRKVIDVSDVFWSNYVGRDIDVVDGRLHDGMYVKKAGENAIYYVQAGKRRPVIGDVVGPVQVVSETIINRVPKDERPLETREVAKDPAYTNTTPIARVEPRRPPAPAEPAPTPRQEAPRQEPTPGGAPRTEPTSPQPPTAPAPTTAPIGSATPVKIAFTGDTDGNENTKAVFQLIKNEGVQALVVQGDFNYKDNPQVFIDDINAAFGTSIPVFIAKGHHEEINDTKKPNYTSEWPIYQQEFLRRAQTTPGVDCKGDYGVNSLCHFKGVGIILSGADGYGMGHDTYVKNNLLADPSGWKICSFHTSEWDNREALAVMEECRKAGAIVSVSHDHAYGRTFVLDSFVTRNRSGESSPLRIKKGQTFMMISGLGGQGTGGIENLAANPSIFASAVTALQKPGVGALFCEFNKGGVANKASCYFKNTAGKIWDQFDIINDESASPAPLPQPTPDPTPTPSPTPTPTPPPSPTPAPTPTAGKMRIGTNISENASYSAEKIFTDQFKSGDGWVSSKLNGCGAGKSWDCGPKIDLDANGWIKSLAPNVDNGGHVAHFVFLSGSTAQYNPGRITITYEGSGTLKVSGATEDKAASRPGIIYADIASGSTGNVYLTISATDPNNYIKNIQVLLPGYASHKGTVQYHPDFLNSMQMYKGKPVRFMNLMIANNNMWTVEYDDYPQLADAVWGARGVPMAKLTELCNLLPCDPWFAFPHKMSDAAIRQAAQEIKNTLNPNSKIYIEFTNEAWNSIFRQHGDLARMGCGRYSDLRDQCDQDVTPGNGVLCEGYGTGAYIKNQACTTASQRYFSDRSVEIWNIFESVFGGTSRLVRVMASQAASSGLSNTYLSWNNNYQKTDALAIAPYFGDDPGRDPNVSAWTVDQLLTHLTTYSLPKNTFVWLDNTVKMLSNNPNYARIKLIAYEGGQHLVGVGSLQNDTKMMNLFHAVNRDPRMKQLYTQYLNGVAARGVTEFAHFTDVGRQTKYGSWGAKEYTSQACSAAPKCDALATF